MAPSDASLAVDGVSSTDALHPGCASTRLQSDPWLVVDLGDEHTVFGVVITGRGDCCGTIINITIGPLAILVKIFSSSQTNQSFGLLHLFSFPPSRRVNRGELPPPSPAWTLCPLCPAHWRVLTRRNPPHRLSIWFHPRSLYQTLHRGCQRAADRV